MGKMPKKGAKRPTEAKKIGKGPKLVEIPKNRLAFLAVIPPPLSTQNINLVVSWAQKSCLNHSVEHPGQPMFWFGCILTFVYNSIKNCVAKLPRRCKLSTVLNKLGNPSPQEAIITNYVWDIRFFKLLNIQFAEGNMLKFIKKCRECHYAVKAPCHGITNSGILTLNNQIAYTQYVFNSKQL